MKLEINPYALQELKHKCCPDVLTVGETQKILKIGRLSVYHLIESGQLQAFRIGRTYHIPKKPLMQFLETRGEVL